jgi:hypothetical protein
MLRDSPELIYGKIEIELAYRKRTPRSDQLRGVLSFWLLWMTTVANEADQQVAKRRHIICQKLMPLGCMPIQTAGVGDSFAFLKIRNSIWIG